MKNLTDWLKANKISLNVKKTELGILKRKANTLLFKIKNYVNFNTLKSIYFAIFDPHMDMITDVARNVDI